MDSVRTGTSRSLGHRDGLDALNQIARVHRFTGSPPPPSGVTTSRRSGTHPTPLVGSRPSAYRDAMASIRLGSTSWTVPIRDV